MSTSPLRGEHCCHIGSLAGARSRRLLPATGARRSDDEDPQSDLDEQCEIAEQRGAVAQGGVSAVAALVTVGPSERGPARDAMTADVERPVPGVLGLEDVVA